LLAWLYWAAFAYIRHELADPNIPRHGRMASIDPWQVYFKNLFFSLSLSLVPSSLGLRNILVGKNLFAHYHKVYYNIPNRNRRYNKCVWGVGDNKRRDDTFRRLAVSYLPAGRGWPALSRTFSCCRFGNQLAIVGCCLLCRVAPDADWLFAWRELKKKSSCGRLTLVLLVCAFMYYCEMKKKKKKKKFFLSELPLTHTPV
jgi:hypothetical protein